MTSFEVIILGGLGGPSESSTQCFMVRPYGSNDIKSICIDGGAGVGHIMDTVVASTENLIPNNNNNTKSDDAEYYDDFHNYFKDLNRYHDNQYKMSRRSKRMKLMKLTPSMRRKMTPQNPTIQLGFAKNLIESLNDKPTILQKAYAIYQGIDSYYITHPHLDHINGMILNSPLMFEREISSRKTIYGLPFTTTALQTYVFNDIIWPNLCNEKSSNLHIETLQETHPHKLTGFPHWEIIPFKLCHGTKVIDGSRVFSTVFILRDNETKNTLIFFGDTDYNQFIQDEQNNTIRKNLLTEFWEYMVELVPLEELRGIFIECSGVSHQRDEQLYGHLSPKHLIDNLKELYDKYNAKSPISTETGNLFNPNIIITHVKMIPSHKDPRITIINELRTLQKENKELEGIKFSLALNKHRFIL